MCHKWNYEDILFIGSINCTGNDGKDLFQFWIIFHPDLHEMCGWGKTLDFVQPGRGEK